MSKERFSKPEDLLPGDLVRLYLDVSWDPRGEPVHVYPARAVFGIVLKESSPMDMGEYFIDRTVFSQQYFSPVGLDVLTEEREIVACTVAPHLVELLRRMR